MPAPRSSYSSSTNAGGEYSPDLASKEPATRLILLIFKMGSEERMADVAERFQASDAEFGRAVADAESGGLLTREERDDGIFLALTPRGQERAAALLRLSSQTLA